MRRIVAILALLATITLVFVAQGAGGSSGTYQIRAIFDNGGFVVPGEDVRIAGANVGSVDSVGVTMPDEEVHANGSPEPGKAIVVMNINDPGFQDFRTDASCLIRPGSLLGEKYIDCQPTQPRAPDTQAPPQLKVVPDGQPGTGEHFLPLENNGKAVDIDLVNNIQREPFADRFRLILNDLGAGLAARGKDLQQIIERADPALRETDQLLGQLARQNHMLARLARDSDAALAPLARERQHVAGFINNANTAGEATAERSADLEAGFQKFPAALRALRGQMKQLKNFSDQARPTFADFAAAAPEITRSTKALGPFAKAATPSLLSLGDAAQKSAQPLVNADPILVKIRNLAKKAAPGAKSLNSLLSSLRQTGGYKKLLHLFYFTVGGINGFDKFGHFLRATLVLNPNCITIVDSVTQGCTANWRSQTTGKLKALARSALAVPAPGPNGAAVTGGTPFDAAGDAAGASPSSGGTGKRTQPRPPSLGAARDLLDTIIGKPGHVKDSGAPSGQYTTPSDQGSTPPSDQGGTAP
jgi:phospholipid/cholesterol/gamma-HCH transport system substrate-binding protein